MGRRTSSSRIGQPVLGVLAEILIELAVFFDILDTIRVVAEVIVFAVAGPCSDEVVIGTLLSGWIARPLSRDLDAPVSISQVALLTSSPSTSPISTSPASPAAGPASSESEVGSTVWSTRALERILGTYSISESELEARSTTSVGSAFPLPFPGKGLISFSGLGLTSGLTSGLPSLGSKVLGWAGPVAGAGGG